MPETLVQKLMKRACITLDENSSIKSLVDTLNKNKVGCVIVTSLESHYPVGIVSERDLVRNFKVILNKNTIKVRDVMTKNIIFCRHQSFKNVLHAKIIWVVLKHLQFLIFFKVSNYLR